VSLDVLPRELFAVVAAIAIIHAVVVWARRWAKRARMQRRWTRAAEGERAAAALLEAQGYVVEGAQVATSYAIEVDGAPVEIAVRADYVVTRGGERFVAEVKTGQLAPRVQTPATRRQLLEYHVAFGASGVLLVDAEARDIHLVAFPAPPQEPRSGGFAWTLAVAAVVVAVIVAAR
jgi:hypothetical protein